MFTMGLSEAPLGAGSYKSGARRIQQSTYYPPHNRHCYPKAQQNKLSVQWLAKPTTRPDFDFSGLTSYEEIEKRVKQDFNIQQKPYSYDRFFWLKVNDIYVQFQFIFYNADSESTDALFIQTIHIDRPNLNLGELENSLEGIDWINVMKILIIVIRYVTDTSWIGGTKTAVKRFFDGLTKVHDGSALANLILNKLRTAYSEIEQTTEFQNLTSYANKLNKAGEAVVGAASYVASAIGIKPTKS